MLSKEHLVRFWSKVRISPGKCWEWQAWKDMDGYGGVQILGRLKRAHRVSYEILRGEIPDGLQIDHVCRNRSCVNPLHLEAVTCRENVLRGLLGSLHTHCKEGHEISGDNVYIRSGTCGHPVRQCKECRTKKAAEWYQRNKKRISEKNRVKK